MSDMRTRSLSIRWADMVALVLAYGNNNLTEEHLASAVRTKLNRHIPDARYYASMEAYTAAKAGIPAGDLLFITVEGAMTLYVRTDAGETLICTFPAGGGSAEVTAAAVAAAVGQMDITQKAGLQTALGYLLAPALASGDAGKVLGVVESGSSREFALLTLSMALFGGGFGTCPTALNTAGKVVQINGFTRTQNVPFVVKFTNGAKNGDTLDVRSSSSSSSGTGAAALYYNGSAIPNGLISAGAVATLYYDGSNYSVLSVSAMDNGFGVCSGNGTNRAVTITGLAVATGTRVSVRFDTYDVPASATLNINSYGAKAIRRNGAAIAAGVISAGDVATFVYDGTYWQLVGIMPANPASDSNEFITMTRSGSTVTASKTASQIYGMVTDNQANVVLIDEFGRQCDLCDKPTSGSGRFSPAKFFTLDEANEVLIVYSVADTTGEVTSESISLGGSSGGGAEVFSVAITTGTGASSTKTAAEIYAAKQAGKIIQCSIDGNTATLLENCAATESRFFEISVDSGRMLRAVTVGTSNNATTISKDVWTIGNAEAVTLTGTTPSISPVVDNTIYTGGELTSLNVGTWTDGRRFTLIFTSGSSPTSLVWANNHEPVWPANFDGTPEANTRYEINVVGGYAVVGAWEVSS